MTKRGKRSMKLSQAVSPRLPKAVCVMLGAVLSVICCAASGMCFILISGAGVPVPVMIFSTAALILLPAFIIKTYSVFIGLRSRPLLTGLMITGLFLSLYPTVCYYIGKDYDISVYRYMRGTDADVYYFGGYEGVTRDYLDGADLMAQMQAAPASIVLESMSEEKLKKLTAEQLKVINSENLWDYFGFGEILGSDPDEVEASIRASRSMSAYEFTFGYRDLKAKTTGYMLAHPEQIRQELYSIIRTGSHTVGASVLAAFLLSQLFTLYVTGYHFDVNAKGQLVYIYEPTPPEERFRALRFTAAVIREMASHWYIM